MGAVARGKRGVENRLSEGHGHRTLRHRIRVIAGLGDAQGVAARLERFAGNQAVPGIVRQLRRRADPVPGGRNLLRPDPVGLLRYARMVEGLPAAGPGALG